MSPRPARATSAPATSITDQPRTPTTPRQPIPPLLAALAAFLGEHQHAEFARALDVARRIRPTGDDGDVSDHISRFIGSEADRGPWKAWHRAFTGAGSIAPLRDFDPPNDAGHAFNVYSTPALILGAAIAYVVLTNDQGGAR